MAVIVGAILDRIIEDRRIGGETGHRTAAKSWYRKAAPRGDANAEFNLWSCTPMPLWADGFGGRVRARTPYSLLRNRRGLAQLAQFWINRGSQVVAAGLTDQSAKSA